MSQLVFQSTSGGSIIFTGATTGSTFNVVVPASNGTLLYADSSNNLSVNNLIVGGTSSFASAATFSNTASFFSFTCSQDAIFSGTGEITLPVGTTAQRSSSPTTGMIRYNSSYGQFEGYNGSAWGIVGGGATGGGNNNQVFVLNDQTVTTNYTIPSGKNASTAGAITINTGIVVTVSTGSRWVIV